MNSRLQSKDNENVSLRKDLELTRKDLKAATANLNSTEVRLNRASEEIDRLKEILRVTKEEDKVILPTELTSMLMVMLFSQDNKEKYKKQVSELTKSLQALEKQKGKLFEVFKKQHLLIDNLKRQKV